MKRLVCVIERWWMNGGCTGNAYGRTHLRTYYHKNEHEHVNVCMLCGDVR